MSVTGRETYILDALKMGCVEWCRTYNRSRGAYYYIRRNEDRLVDKLVAQREAYEAALMRVEGLD